MKVRTRQRIFYSDTNRCNNQYAVSGCSGYGSKWLLKIWIDQWGNKHGNNPLLLKANIEVTEEQLEKSRRAQEQIDDFC